MHFHHFFCIADIVYDLPGSGNRWVLNCGWEEVSEKAILYPGIGTQFSLMIACFENQFINFARYQQFPTLVSLHFKYSLYGSTYKLTEIIVFKLLLPELTGLPKVRIYLLNWSSCAAIVLLVNALSAVFGFLCKLKLKKI